MKDSLGREPRWNADRCAAPSQSLLREGQGGGSGRTRKARQNATLRLSAFRLRIFLGSFFFLPFFPSVIRAEAALANASTGVCVLQFRMEH